jgi:hypothetical protein
VPSPESTNCLFNPLHPDARKVRVEWSRWIDYDRRLFQMTRISSRVLIDLWSEPVSRLA